MELGLPGEVVQVEVEEEEAEAEVGWEVTVPESVPVGSVSVLVVEPDYHIR